VRSARAARLALDLATAALASACATPDPGPSEQPARLVEPDDAARAELRAAVASFFGGAPVPLTDDALTQTSQLVVERAALRDPAGLRVDGRDLGRPQLFDLKQVDGFCVLVHRASGRRVTLPSAHCASP